MHPIPLPCGTPYCPLADRDSTQASTGRKVLTYRTAPEPEARHSGRAAVPVTPESDGNLKKPELEIARNIKLAFERKPGAEF